MSPDFDYAIVGGGLQGGLIAQALCARQKRCTLALIERGERLGGNHTWCFQDRDLPAAAASWVEPLIERRFPDYEVRFPTLQRTLKSGYSVIASAHFDQVVTSTMGSANQTLILGREVESVCADHVVLAGGERLGARAVIDARGPERDPSMAAGYQKFVGLEITTPQPHRIRRPVLMDATVAQLDGFRFVYVIPLADDRLLVEDTYFSNSAELDRSLVRQRVLSYCKSRGLAVGTIEREEHGVLPMPWSGGPTPQGARGGPLVAGYRGGWFHPGTGYSFPAAVRLALALAEAGPDPLAEPAIAALASQIRKQARYARALNRLLFRWCRPDARWHILARFYRLPQATIERFYALEATAGDRARILVGKPPPGLSLRNRLQKRRAA